MGPSDKPVSDRTIEYDLKFLLAVLNWLARCRPETLREAYAMARRNGGAAGIDGVTFDVIEEAGPAGFLEGIRGELVFRAYRPSGNRRVEIPKDGGKVRTLGIPPIRDRVVQGALKLILEPVSEADFQVDPMVTGPSARPIRRCTG